MNASRSSTSSSARSVASSGSAWQARPLLVARQIGGSSRSVTRWTSCAGSHAGSPPGSARPAIQREARVAVERNVREAGARVLRSREEREACGVDRGRTELARRRDDERVRIGERRGVPLDRFADRGGARVGGARPGAAAAVRDGRADERRGVGGLAPQGHEAHVLRAGEHLLDTADDADVRRHEGRERITRQRRALRPTVLRPRDARRASTRGSEGRGGRSAACSGARA